MGQADHPTLTCPGCGTRYRWREAFVGRVLDCKCGASFRADEALAPADGASVENGAAGAAVVNGAAVVKGADGEAGSDGAARTVDGVAGALRPRTTAAARYVSGLVSRARAFYLPAIVIAVGWSIAFGLWQRVGETAADMTVLMVAALALQVAVFLPAMVATMVALAGWFDLGLGTLGSVLIKCVALTLGPAAAVDALFTWMMAVADFDWWLLAAGYAYYLVLSGIPMAIAFGLNVHETALGILLVYIPRVAAVYVAALAFPEAFAGVL